MLFSVEGKQITEVAHVHQRMKNLQKGDYRAIIDKLNRVFNCGDVHTSSWIPGQNWRGTLYEPIRLACRKNNEVAAKFYGQILFKVMIDHPNKWCFGDYPHSKGKTYFKIN